MQTNSRHRLIWLLTDRQLRSFCELERDEVIKSVDLSFSVLKAENNDAKVQTGPP